MNADIIKDGTKVSGEYYGQKYSGVVRKSHVPYHRSWVEYAVVLDSPITVFGQERSEAYPFVHFVDSKDARLNNNTIAA